MDTHRPSRICPSSTRSAGVAAAIPPDTTASPSPSRVSPSGRSRTQCQNNHLLQPQLPLRRALHHREQRPQFPLRRNQRRKARPQDQRLPRDPQRSLTTHPITPVPEGEGLGVGRPMRLPQRHAATTAPELSSASVYERSPLKSPA